MPASRTGGAIGKRLVATTTAASGVWQIGEAEAAVRSAIWPAADAYSSSVALLLHMDGTNNSTTFTDSGPSARSITANGDAKVSTAQSKFGGASCLLDGNGDYLTAGTSTGYDIGTGDMTLEAWVYFTTVPTTGYAGFANTHTSTTSATNTHWHWGYRPGTGFYFARHTDGTHSYCSWTPVVNTWYAVAAVRSSGSISLYIDGVSQTVTNATRFSAVSFSGGTLAIGMIATPHYFAGYIDEFRFTRAARYSASYTPSGPFPPA